MATSETNIRQAVALLLHKYGSLNTSEVKKLLHTVMPFDNDDIQQVSGSRTFELSIMQRIGNIVSHQKEPVKIYFDTYQIDKTKNIAEWSLLTGMQTYGTLKPISDIEIVQKRSKAFTPKIIDWQAINNRRTELGYLGECFVLGVETQRILSFAPQDIERLIHLSAEQGDGSGFDIISFNEDGSDRYIEVKTTEQGFGTPFYITANELEFFKLHKNDNSAFIYRVYDFNRYTKTGYYQIISAQDLFNKYRFDPISYQVTLS